MFAQKVALLREALPSAEQSGQKNSMTHPPRKDPMTASLPRLAYLTSLYPSVSHTFILREVTGLRSLGIDVLPASIRKSPSDQHPGDAEKAEAQLCFNVIPAAKQPGTLLKAFGFALARPTRLSQIIALAWKMRRAGLKGTVWQGAYLVEALIIGHWLKRSAIDHLHVHFTGGVATAGMLAAELADIPWSLTIHGPADFNDPIAWQLGLKVKHATFVACISHFARSQVMLQTDPIDWPKLHIVHCGIEPALYDRKTARPTEPVELLFVGRLAPVKGLRVLLEAMKRVDAPIRLTIVGDGPDRANLEQIAVPLGERVRFTGYLSQQQVAETLAKTHIVVLPSFAEGVPVMLMEAMAAGLPVIATRVAGTGELVEDGVSGRLVPPGDSETLAQAIDALATDPDLRCRMGEAGRARVRSDFDCQSEARRLAGLFVGQSSDGPRPDEISA